MGNTRGGIEYLYEEVTSKGMEQQSNTSQITRNTLRIHLRTNTVVRTVTY